MELESEGEDEEDSSEHTEDPGSYNIARDRPRREITPPVVIMI